MIVKNFGSFSSSSEILLGNIILNNKCDGFITLSFGDNDEVIKSEVKKIATQDAYLVDDREDGNVIKLELISDNEIKVTADYISRLKDKKEYLKYVAKHFLSDFEPIRNDNSGRETFLVSKIEGKCPSRARFYFNKIKEVTDYYLYCSGFSIS